MICKHEQEYIEEVFGVREHRMIVPRYPHIEGEYVKTAYRITPNSISIDLEFFDKVKTVSWISHPTKIRPDPKVKKRIKHMWIWNS